MSVPGMVSLQPATPDDDLLLRNLLELYIHDLSDVFQVELGPDGRFGYARLPLYWAEPATRYAFIIRCGARVAGFALVTRGSPATDNPTDLDVAEFFVLRAHRHSGVGRQAAVALWDRVPGRWVVRVSESNHKGLSFWSEIIRSYTSGAFLERVLEEHRRRWRIFTFETPHAGTGSHSWHSSFS